MEMCARLLDRDPKMRLGSNGGAEEVRQNPWVADIDWEKVYSKQITPPIDPKVNPDNFDPMFTKKEVPQVVTYGSMTASQIEGGHQLAHWSFTEGLNGSQTEQ